MSYSVEGLERGIRHAKKNIKIYEKAIEGERSNIASFRVMIDDIETADKNMALAKSEEKRLNGELNGVSK